MSQLLIVVLSIVLLAIVIAGGVNYMSTDVGVRYDTARQIATSRNAIEGALASYRMANRGALPPVQTDAEDLRWKDALDGYIVDGGYHAPQGMTWRYLEDVGGERILCLELDEGADLSEAVKQGLENAVRDGTELREACTGSGEAGTALVMSVGQVE